MDGELTTVRPVDYTRRISPEAAARLAAPSSHCDSSILCHLDCRPPPPRRQVPPTPAADIPPPLPAKPGENGTGRRHLLHLRVPLSQKIGDKIATDNMREKSITHVPIHRQNPSEPPQIPPRTRTSPQSPPRPLPSLAGGGSHNRAQNEYVDSPHTQKKRYTGGGSEIIKQPELKKPLNENHKDSIYCRNCGKCRCKSCTNPQVSQESEHTAKRVVEVCSCMCCVKGLFYHCNEEESSESDDPCACSGQPHCVTRWSTMTILSIFLPCLCLYWPLKGCVALCQSCYRRCSVRGCRCRRDRDGGDYTQERYLMEESSSTGT